MDRIAITGFGAVSPLGTDAPSTWESLREGRSGVSALEADWASQLTTRIAGTVPSSFTDALAVREIKRLDRCEQFALVAGREAWEMAGRPEIDGDRLGVVVGTGIGGITTTIVQEHILDDSGPRRVSPHTVTMLMGNGAAAWLSIDLGAKAGARTPTSACASGAEALAMGREMILAGSADVVVAGGSEAAITGLTLAAFGQIRALSKRNDDPEAASRPFDADRDGFVLGEGAALLVLERESHARARGAEIYAYLEGAAVTSDAFDIVGADPSNQARTMTLALRAADFAPGDIDFVHAHATATPTGDVNESEALAETGIDAPVTSTKSMTGHLLGASGSLSAIASVMALREGVVPPTTNLTTIDPAIKLDVVANVKREVDARAAIVNSFGFGGHNAALVLSRA
ncbi:beta-ketoacyl-[acyl-carrier-protein] synthase family protein [Sinomonas terrae]|uniref:Beta-ketoacyl-[acyl-carrier-protein] synthase family protein n=1 Tax=Sinomonas terrae TaxID=2908838 RepID=A0ABS9U675_9MICC|nr:beta-ketoacyl-[acyl-carrier-protein] synthase family protein [Sinomonas terrae]MCH6472174.1 beta-ketoacyl-[acyl-carrier-protein] synthase family protein [Sinomonas terrae]